MGLKQKAIQWLLDGDEIEAAEVLQRCDVECVGGDIGFAIDSERTFSLTELVIYAPRQVLVSIRGRKRRLAGQIDDAIRQLAHANTVIQSLSWSGKASDVDSAVFRGQDGTLTAVDSVHVQIAWMKALARRRADPDGAITAARSLLE